MSGPSVLKRCRRCKTLRPTDPDNKLIGHDRWDPDKGFVPCDGSGRLPEYARVDDIRTELL